jgi:PAS domain S-box-containing protein
MTTIVGIFDNERDLDKSVGRLAHAGFKYTIYDEAIVAGEQGNFGSVVFSPSYGPTVSWGSTEPALLSKRGRYRVVQAFKAHLADYDLPNKVIEAYASTFSENGHFVLVKTDPVRAEQVMEILRECGARQVDCNDTSASQEHDPIDIFDFLLENTPDQIYFKDRRGRFLRASRAVAELLGAPSAKDLLGKTDFDFWSVETARAAAADEQRIMKTREPLVGKIERLVHRDGRISWDYTTKMPLLDTRGQVIGICGINKDFTAMKCMQDALEEERDRLKATIAELEAKNAQLQADLQLTRGIQESVTR